LGTDEMIAERVSRYRHAGITTLLAKLDGDYAAQLSTLESVGRRRRRLMAIRRPITSLGV
jgi:hypothetical protein